MKKLITTLFILMAVLTVSACGGKNSSASYDEGGSMPAAAKTSGAMNFSSYEDADAAVEEAYAEESFDSTSGETGPEEVTEGAGKSSRKLITTVDIRTETDDVQAFADRIEKKVAALGGYLESGNIYTDNSYHGDDPVKSADFTVRIPADRLEDFLNDVDGNSNIISRSTNTKDVTLEYTDTEAHERALSLEQKSLERMLEMAETVDDIMAIQSQLTDVRYRLDSIRSQLRTYDNQVEYSTVYLNISETRRFTVTKEETPLERIRNGFIENLLDVMDAVAEFLIWFITHIPAFLLFGILVFAAVMLIKAIIRSGKRKKEHKIPQRPVPAAKAPKAPEVTAAPEKEQAGTPDGK